MAEAIELQESGNADLNVHRTISEKRRRSAQIALASYKSHAEYEMLKERVDELEKLYNEECEEKERYMDEAADKRSELEEAQQKIKDLEGEKLQLIERKRLVDEHIKKMSNKLGEYQVTKTKLELFQNESKLEIERYREDIGQLNYRLKQTKQRLQQAEIRAASAIDHLPFTENEQDVLERYNPGSLDFECKDDIENIEKNYQEVYKRLLIEMQKNREMRNNFQQEDLKRGSSEKERDGEIVKLRKQVGQLTRQKQDLEDIQEDYKRTKTSLHRMRELYDKQRKEIATWKRKMTQFENASILKNNIYQKDRMKFKQDLAQKEANESRLKMMYCQLAKKSKKTTITGRPSNVCVPIKLKTHSRRKTRQR